MEYVSIVLSVFFIEFVVDYLVLKIYKINYKFLYLLFLQVPKICSSVICVLYSQMLWLCMLVKIASKIICVVFITDSFRPKKILSLLLSEILILFSVGGFISFLGLCLNSSLESVFLYKIPQKYSFLVNLFIILYIFAFFKIVRYVQNNKFAQKYLTKVSFFIEDKHINLYGLIDSGNSLLDPLTRLPVVLISFQCLRRYFSIFEMDNLIGNKCRKIKCDTISGSGFEIPVFKAQKFVARIGRESRKFVCMIGVVDRKFENGKFDCLLHRDFL